MITPTLILPHAASSDPTTTTTGTGSASPQGLDTMFLQLLVAQLQNQDPTSPLDPSQFVGQLAQFSELSEVTQIDQLLQQYAGSGTAATGGSTPTTGGSSPTTTPSSGGPAKPVSLVTPSVVVPTAGAAAQSVLQNFTSPAESFLNHKIQGVF